MTNASILTAPAGGLSQVPDFTLLREDNAAAIWVILGHAKFHVPDPTTLARLYGTTVVQVFNGCLAGIATAPANGTLLREENGAVRVIFGQAKFQVPDPGTLNRLYKSEPICQVWNGALDTVANIPVDGTMLREENGAVWVIFGQAKFQVPDPATLGRLYANVPVFPVWTGALDAIPSVPMDGTLLHEENSGKVWIIYGGAKFRVTYGGPPPSHPLWDGAVDPIPTIPVDGTLVTDETNKGWAILGGAKFPVPDYVNLQSFFPGAVFAYLAWQGTVDPIPLIPKDGYLIREFSNPQVYVIQGGRKVPTVPPPGAVVAKIWDGALSQIPD